MRIVFITIMAILMLSTVAAIEYPPNTHVSFPSNCLDEETGLYINSTSNITINYPNGSVFVETATMHPIQAGRFQYNFTTPLITGTYSVLKVCRRVSGGGLAEGGDEFQIKDINEEVERLGGFLLIILIGIGVLFAWLGHYLDNITFYLLSGTWFLFVTFYGGLTIFSGIQHIFTGFLVILTGVMFFHAWDEYGARARHE